MQRKNLNPFLPLILMLILVLVACSTSATPPAATSTRTPKPTATKTAVMTYTPKATLTTRPTLTPNVTATYHMAERNAEAQKYFDLGYLPSAEGRFFELDDFKQDWAQLNWYRWWTYDISARNFYMSAHFKWSSAYRQADISGCGFAFGIQENQDNYAVFLDRSRVLFIDMDQSYGYYRPMGPTRGTGQANFGNPADSPVEADFTLIVRDAYAYVLVDGELAGEYTLSQSRPQRGKVGLTLLSGTNKDYGTRCEMTNLHLWLPYGG